MSWLQCPRSHQSLNFRGLRDGNKDITGNISLCALMPIESGRGVASTTVHPLYGQFTGDSDLSHSSRYSLVRREAAYGTLGMLNWPFSDGYPFVNSIPK